MQPGAAEYSADSIFRLVCGPALAKEYGKKEIVYSGPMFKSMKVEGNKIRLSFAHLRSGLKSRDGKPVCEFEIASADDKFVTAEATIDSESVVAEAKEITSPTQVRFGWRNEANPNLVIKEGLPASPFRTRVWQGVGATRPGRLN